MEPKKIMMMDGNEATAYIAYRVNEVCAIYPITPSSPMAEYADVWTAKGVVNLWGNVPQVIEMQSEGGAAGAVHGSLQAGALTTTFTASQGLMLMLPNMYKIAGELTPAVFHVAARSLAAQALSIFGDHTDVMAARTTGFAMVSSASVQEAHDLALISQATTLKTRIPVLHFFDGFRTSHEINKIEIISDRVIRALIDDNLVYAHRQRALSPDNPFIRGTAQNPDVYFQGRETVNAFYQATPGIMQEMMDKFATLTGRQYQLFEYYGDPEAREVIILMGSGAETVKETVKRLNEGGRKTGVLQVRLYRPFSVSHFVEKLPPVVRKIAVLDRTKEIGATGEPLYLDVVNSLFEYYDHSRPKRDIRVVGGRYGLGSKEFTPAMVKGIYDHLKQENLLNHFTIGIDDDVTHTSLPYDPAFNIEKGQVTRALFFGLGSDGTVGANKNSIKIIGENTSLYAQGYFVYDSKKSGSKTISHLRFGPEPIRAPYLIERANFIACHQFNFLEKMDLLQQAEDGAVFLLNSPYGPEEIWEYLPVSVQETIVRKKLRFYIIDALKVAAETGMGRRINTIMQTCFFALSGVLPRDEAIGHIKKSIEKTYYTKGRPVIERNFQAVDTTLAYLKEVHMPERMPEVFVQNEAISNEVPDFVREVTMPMMEGLGDSLPVSALPVDGTYPSGTTKWEKRNIADQVPLWEPDLCIQCGNCSFVCPHSVIRAKFYHEKCMEATPASFKSAPINARGFPDTNYTLQIYSEDCTGCTLCVDACPVNSPKEPGKKAINMVPNSEEIRLESRESARYFEAIPWNDRSKVDFSSVRGSQFLEPLFEFSGACSGCGETPYLSLLSRLFGDRLIIANATGCSSIYGGNLPTTPWTRNAEGRGPAWSNSLFEDNAEFGLGMRVAVDKQRDLALVLLEKLEPQLGSTMIRQIAGAPQKTESEIRNQRERVAWLKTQLLKMDSDDARELLSVADHLVRRSVWLVGGDGWAYDIGSGGLDHALASGRDINILVLDTEVYSNTGGQMSKATPPAATAKFAYGGKQVGKKDLALQAISYGNVYVAQIAMGANPQQTLLALREAEAYPGPSLILAYSHCIAHGIAMETGMQQQKLAVESAYWPLIRYNPELRKAMRNPFVLDSPSPRKRLEEYAYNEMRYKILTRTNPAEAERLMKLASEMVDLRWKTYERMAETPASGFKPVH